MPFRRDDHRWFRQPDGSINPRPPVAARSGIFIRESVGPCEITAQFIGNAAQACVALEEGVDAIRSFEGLSMHFAIQLVAAIGTTATMKIRRSASVS